jgi:hypothetical protein
MRVHECTSNTAVILVTSSVIDLPIVVQRLLPHCGFSRASHVFLLDNPEEHDIARCRIMTVSSRGDYSLKVAGLSEAIAKRLEPFAIAAGLAPEDAGRLHLFADRASPGWTSIVGGDNWSVGGAS